VVLAIARAGTVTKKKAPLPIQECQILPEKAAALKNKPKIKPKKLSGLKSPETKTGGGS
jgi:hypothetical protein